MNCQPVSRHGPVHWTQAGFAALCMMAANGLASAQPSIYTYSAACHGSDCSFGPTSFWTPPNGVAGNTSVSKGWSYIGSGSDTSYNYSASAAAQASVAGVDRWAAASSAGGYFNSPGTYTGNGVGGSGIIHVRDEFTLPSTPGWNGPGWFRLSYRITGGASVSYSETSHVSGQTLGAAQSSITFECGSARVGGVGSSRCESADFAPPQPGSLNLIGRLNFDSSQSVDRVVSFDIPVHSNLLYAYRLQTTVSSSVWMNALNRTGLVQGTTAADFSHTFSLADAQLFDAGFNPVTQWSVASASGFDYANIAAVPEPGTATLLALGCVLLGYACAGLRRPVAAAERR